MTTEGTTPSPDDRPDQPPADDETVAFGPDPALPVPPPAPAPPAPGTATEVGPQASDGGSTPWRARPTPPRPGPAGDAPTERAASGPGGPAGPVGPTPPPRSGGGGSSNALTIVAIGGVVVLVVVILLMAVVLGGGDDGDDVSTSGSTSTTTAETTASTTESTTTSTPTTPSTAPPATDPQLPGVTIVVNDDGDELEPGLLCQQLSDDGADYDAAVAYWLQEGRPERMDADGNGIPCETVYPTDEVAAFWGSTDTAEEGVDPDLLCADLAEQGLDYGAAVAYWEQQGRPARMDDDANGIPCESVYPPADVEAYWSAGG